MTSFMKISTRLVVIILTGFAAVTCQMDQMNASISVQPPTTKTYPEDSNPEKSHIDWRIVGPSIGGAVLLIAIIVVIVSCCCCRRRCKKCCCHSEETPITKTTTTAAVYHTGGGDCRKKETSTTNNTADAMYNISMGSVTVTNNYYSGNNSAPEPNVGTYAWNWITSWFGKKK